MKFNKQEKKKLVNSVFSNVHQKYDLMNDIMSFGIHRGWKKKLLNWINPQEGERLIDVASGTGDMAKLFSEKVKNKSIINCLEQNKDMLEAGKKKLKYFKNISWHLGSAEKLPFKDNTFDYYTISYGIRNVTDINLTIKEAFRVLKTGGRFFCLEFSKIENELLSKMYYQYSKVIPVIGKYIVGDAMPYKYLVESIDNFYNQEELLDIIKKNNFSNVEYRNLSNGISAIHTGWKI